MYLSLIVNTKQILANFTSFNCNSSINLVYLRSFSYRLVIVANAKLAYVNKARDLSLSRKLALVNFGKLLKLCSQQRQICCSPFF